MTLKRSHAGPPVIDAHRHGLYDKQVGFTLAGVPVERWEDDPRFLAHERWTKSLDGPGLRAAMRPWLRYSRREGVGAVLDFSGKHARAEVAAVYRRQGVDHYSPEWWSRWRPEADPPARALILPDERGLNEQVARRAREFLSAVPDGFLTLHALESEFASRGAREQWGCSTVEWLDRQGLLTPRALLVHLNAAGPDDFCRVRDRGAHAVFCPAVRLALGNPEPPFVPGAHLHFGTDAPLVSGERRLWAQAALQWRLWARGGVPEETALREAALALFRPLPTGPAKPWAADTLVERYGHLLRSWEVDFLSLTRGGKPAHV
jgi:hypothetical protein